MPRVSSSLLLAFSLLLPPPLLLWAQEVEARQGMSGHALHMVYTLSFRPLEEGTLVHLDVRGSGELEEAWPGVIASVWHHFLRDRFKPFAEGRPGESPSRALPGG